MVHIYADESGNTGSNLLDPDQRDYFAGAIMAQEDLDWKYAETFSVFARERGYSYLHAGEIGMESLDELFPKLERLIKRDTLRFFLGRIDKRWFILAKYFDLLFDPHDNHGAFDHVYWMAGLRYVILLKLNHIVREEDLRQIWEATITPDADVAKTMLSRASHSILGRIKEIPDQRSRTIIMETLKWGVDNPEDLGLRVREKAFLLNHYPNVAMITPMLGAIQEQAEFWKTKPGRIVHDRNSQFQSAWSELHAVLSRPTSFSISLIGGAEAKLGISDSSQFVIGDTRTSAGIQFIDIILWLWQRHRSGAILSRNAESLFAKANQRSNHYEMSAQMTERLATATLLPIMAKDFSEEELVRGRELLELGDRNRRARMERG